MYLQTTRGWEVSVLDRSLQTMNTNSYMGNGNTVPESHATLDGEWTYRVLYLRRVEEVVRVLEDLTLRLTAHGYSAKDRFGVQLALEEAIVNALRHGNGGNPTKRVLVRYLIDAEVVMAEVQDEGPGFDPETVSDPTRPENLDRPSGRGLMLMRHFMTSVHYHGCGNVVTLCKRPTIQPLGN
jgi:serine/threonine-protein kinase RsbW